MTPETTTLDITGGGELGWVRATWPLMRLTSRRDCLIVGGGIIGRYPFAPENVAAIKPIGRSKVSIRHNVKGYPGNIVFFTAGRADVLIERITATGFVPAATTQEQSLPPQSNGFGGWGLPFRTWFWVSFVILWNLLLIGGMATSTTSPDSRFIFAAVMMLLIVTAGLLIFPPLQRVALKPGHCVQADLRVSLLFVLFVAGGMSIISGAISLILPH